MSARAIAKKIGVVVLYALGALALLFAVILALWLWSWHVAPFHGDRFDRARWDAALACTEEPGGCFSVYTRCDRSAMRRQTCC